MGHVLHVLMGHLEKIAKCVKNSNLEMLSNEIVKIAPVKCAAQFRVTIKKDIVNVRQMSSVKIVINALWDSGILTAASKLDVKIAPAIQSAHLILTATNQLVNVSANRA